MVIATETDRLDALRQLGLLDISASESFDRIMRMATLVFGLPIAAVSLTDSNRHWFKSCVAIEHWSIPRDKKPCAQVAETRDQLVIENLVDAPSYKNSVSAQAGICFYAGATSSLGTAIA